MPGNFYVIGDVHGCAEELKILLHKLPLDQDSTLLFLGDYVDRGPDAKGVIDTILDISGIYNVITLKGNHEMLFMQYLENPRDSARASNFIFNGGSATLASYSADGTAYTIPVAHIEFLKKLKVFHATEKHFFAHAGIPPDFDFSETIDEKTAHQMMWIRSVFLDSKVQWPKIVVHGHTPVEEPEVLPNRINLDTGCVFGRKLTALNLTTGEFTFVAKNQAPDRKFLVSGPKGQTRAQRFAGEVLVELREGYDSYSFKTVNFNEFGLLVFPADAVAAAKVFAVGEKISGVIKPGVNSVFEFRGTVMRVDLVNGQPCYGIKFDQLEAMREIA